MLQKLPAWLLHIYSLSIGMTAFVSRESGLNRSSEYVAFVSNVLAILIVPWNIWINYKLFNQVFANKLMVFTQTFHGLVSGLAVVYTALHRFHYERMSAEIRSQISIYKLKCKMLHSSPTSPSSASIVKLHSGILVYLVVFFNLVSLVEQKHRQVLTPLEMVVIVLFINYSQVIRLTLFKYLRTMCEIYTLFMDSQKGISCSRRGSQIEAIAQLNWCLWKAVSRLNQIHRTQIMAIKLSCFIANIHMAYFGYVFTFQIQGTAFYWTLVGSLTFLLMNGEIFNFDLLCSLVGESYIKNLHKLSKCNTEPGLAELPDWRKSMEEFTLQLVCFPLRIEASGLFEVNKASWLQMFVSSLSFTLVLVQFHLVFNKEELMHKLINKPSI